ncbi:MAG: GNAT family N-acetyltransferase [Rhodococcus sp.]|uniref:N-acetylglutamate synthase, CG3035 family n=1 Tax=Rhodococcus sp. TaxID=1831 RepID=UPI0016966763|nr:GNAT family N-acetyltransferase [Rhodococcus sp. (in: high G+C Gram-positive bacteria)]NLV77899.1 GNAT family N-acetyltransferase [Rhodococcus sp. (in: high G+C Gram-positive bacteria)]
MTTDGPVAANGPVPLGTRVVLRYRLPVGYSHPMTDVIGELVALEPAIVVRTADKQLVQVSPGAVVALKPIAARPIRTSEIRSLEHAAAAAWPGIDCAWIDGWFVRAGAGYTRRANSAAPLGERGKVGDVTDPSTHHRLREWFADRALPLTLQIPERLGRVPDGWETSGATLVMAADLENVPLPPASDPVVVDAAPSAEWLTLHPGGDQPIVAAVLRAVLGGTVGFGRIGAPGATPLAIARAAVTDAPDGRRWVGLSAVRVGDEHRRRGVGTLLCGSLLRWGRDLGATHTYVQVEEDNLAARGLYRELGFVDHHRCRYATGPVG